MTHTGMHAFATTYLQTLPRKNSAMPLLLCAANATRVYTFPEKRRHRSQMIDDIVLFDIFANSTASTENATSFFSQISLNHRSIESSVASQREAFCDKVLEYSLTSSVVLITGASLLSIARLQRLLWYVQVGSSRRAHRTQEAAAIF